MSTVNAISSWNYRRKFFRFPLVLLLWIWDFVVDKTLIITATGLRYDLPEGFTIVNDTKTGVELRWTPAKDRIDIITGSSHPEFRVSGGRLFGYPIAIFDEDGAATGISLEVWSSGRRLDQNVTSDPNNNKVLGNEKSYYNSQPPVTPTIDIDPASIGPYITKRLQYTFSALNNITTNFIYPVEILAEVTRPVRAPGKRPLVVFVHGRYASCYNPIRNITVLEWPCTIGNTPIPNYQGYRYITDVLASQGYITVSISLNSINAQDINDRAFGTGARSILIRYHISILWSRWNRGTTVRDPWGGIFKNKVDMKKIILVGHGLGGEGVHRAAVENTSIDSYQIIGIVSYGPTANSRQVRPDISSVTILPTCDGIVSDLQGQSYIDDSRDIAYSTALRTAVISIGTNHNYFNTQWTPGLSSTVPLSDNDDWSFDDDPVCGTSTNVATTSLRLTPTEQQQVAIVYTCALIRMVTNQSDIGMLQFLDGTFVKPKSIGRAEIGINAVGGSGYRLLYRPNSNNTNTTVSVRNGMSGQECRGSYYYKPTNEITPSCAYVGLFNYPMPHWVPMSSLQSRPGPRAIELQWSNQINATVQFRIRASPGNLTGQDFINIRIANDPFQPPVILNVYIVDNNGINSTLRTNLPNIDGWPGTGTLDRVHARTLRADIKSAGNSKINLSNIVAIGLVSRTTSGRVWVLDIATSKSSISQPVPLNLPVLSIARNLTIPEGNGPQQANVTVVSNRKLTSPASIWYQKGYFGSGYQLTIPAGSRQGQIPYTWIGDNIYSGVRVPEEITIATISGAVTSNYIGTVTIVEDDPIPILTVVGKSSVSAVEGTNLEWKFRFPDKDTFRQYYFAFKPPLSGTELTTADVAETWMYDQLGFLPNPPTPLSSALYFRPIEIMFGLGVTNATITIPLVKDTITEGTEYVRLELQDAAGIDPTIPKPIILTGTVRDR